MWSFLGCASIAARLVVSLDFGPDFILIDLDVFAHVLRLQRLVPRVCCHFFILSLLLSPLETPTDIDLSDTK